MAQVIVTATTQDFAAPAGTVAGQYEVAITDSTGVTTKQDVATPTATFASVAPGDYTASVVLLDSNGGQLGSKQTATFNVPTPATVTVQAANVVTVTVQ